MRLLIAILSLIPSLALAAEPEWLAPDFAVMEAPAGWQPRAFAPKWGFAAISPARPSQERGQCEARLREALCVTTGNSRLLTHYWQSAQCELDSDRYLPTAMEIYDEMPARLRPLYCSLERIFLSDDIRSVAFASAIRQGDEVVGALIGARKSSFDSGLKASDMITWKEQITFGGSKDFLSRDPKLVQLHYDIRLDHMKSDGLFYAVMHELGHVVDFQNNVNRRWEPLSWVSASGAKKSAEFLHQPGVCFYECGSPLSPEKAFSMYDSMRESAFITLYSGVSSMEDFAEYWVWSILLEQKEVSYRIEVPGHPTIDMNPIFTENAKVRAKMDFVRELWGDPETKIGF